MNMLRFGLILGFGIAGCTSGPLDGSGAQPSASGGRGGVGGSSSSSSSSSSVGGVSGGVVSSEGLTVHEWGTFTSVLGSTGKQLSGLHHEEEPLPSFVYARAFGDFMHNKGIEFQPTNVTQKLETPVLYFHSGKPAHVKVSVDFPDGLVSQWFPDASTFQPPRFQVQKVGGGSMTWEADLVPGLSDFPPVAPDDIWAPSRKVDAMPVQVGAEHERFIFYRGIGTFTTPFVVTAQPDGTLTIRNDSREAIPAVFLLRVHQGGGAVVSLGALGAGKIRDHIVSPAAGKENNLDKYVADASRKVAGALVESGLFADEAQAMVDTWSKSYFRTFGTRFLYIVPRPWTDKLLPMHIEPQPASLVRTLVGRVEALTQADEAELVSTVTAAAGASMSAATLIGQLGRLAEPKLRRTLELLQDPAAKQYCAVAVDMAATSR
jgi:hypothetical protein